MLLSAQRLNHALTTLLAGAEVPDDQVQQVSRTLRRTERLVEGS